ncbi:MAG: hypothetical protein ACRDWY_09475 [Actinomycetes bacterium]
MFAAISISPTRAVGESSGGVFVPLTPTRIVSTDSGIGGSSTPLGAGTTRSYTVLGEAGIPTSGVSAVVANVSVLHATSDSASSHLVVWPSGETKPTAKTMYFEEDNSTRSNTTIVKVGSDGKISVYNHSGTVDIGISVTGYFTTTSNENSPGGFVPIKPTRVANTLEGQGVPAGMLPTGSNVDIQVSNDEEIPADATAVFANVDVRSSGSGSIKIVPSGQSNADAPITVKYQDNGPTSSGVILKLSGAGKINFANITGEYGASVNFIIDIQGYFSGHSDEGGSYTPLVATSIYASTNTGGVALAGGETRTLPVAGLAGIPDDGTAGAAALSLTVRDWTATGAFTAFNAGHDELPETNDHVFKVGEGEPSNGSTTTSIVELSHDGKIKVHNTSNASLTFYVSAQGWFTADPDIVDENAAYTVVASPMTLVDGEPPPEEPAPEVSSSTLSEENPESDPAISTTFSVPAGTAAEQEAYFDEQIAAAQQEWAEASSAENSDGGFSTSAAEDTEYGNCGWSSIRMSNWNGKYRGWFLVKIGLNWSASTYRTNVHVWDTSWSDFSNWDFPRNGVLGSRNYWNDRTFYVDESGAKYGAKLNRADFYIPTKGKWCHTAGPKVDNVRIL